MGNYRQLEVWQKSRALATEIYRTTARFPKQEWFGLVQQMRRAAVSIPSNIAEGHGRWTSRDRIHFLLISRGSAFELETQLYIAGDLEYMTAERTDQLVARIHEIARMLNGLIRHYRKNPPP
jgi:four helix bundle protein